MENNKKEENKWILEVCKGDAADRDKIKSYMNSGLDYPYILGHLLFNRIGALAYTTLESLNLLPALNREMRNTLYSIYSFSSLLTDCFIESLNQMKPLCESFHFPYALLKGAYLVSLYRRGQRTSNDIDILVQPEYITDLSTILKGAGFKQGKIQNGGFIPAGRPEIISSRINRGETVPFIKEIGLPYMKYLEVDVNFSLGFMPGADSDIVGKFLSNTQPLIFGSVLTLDPTDFLIHLCAHLYKEATTYKWVEMGRDISLYKYCDFLVFFRNYMNVDFAEKLSERIKELGLNNECYYALYYTARLFDIVDEATDMLLESIKPLDLTFMDRVFDPAKNRMYSYESDYSDWVFCGKRREHLYEVGNGR